MCYTLSVFSRLLLSKLKGGTAFHSYYMGYRAQTSNAHYEIVAWTESPHYSCLEQ